MTGIQVSALDEALQRYERDAAPFIEEFATIRNRQLRQHDSAGGASELPLLLNARAREVMYVLSALRTQHGITVQ